MYGKLNYRCENYIEEVDSKIVKREHFDIVICLSTIKWIHVTFGDIGLKTLFLKVRDQLNPGGLFIFDSQPWKSYKKALNERKVKGDKQEFQAKPIELKPHCFKDYLKAIGLRLIASINQAGE